MAVPDYKNGIDASLASVNMQSRRFDEEESKEGDDYIQREDILKQVVNNPSEQEEEKQGPNDEIEEGVTKTAFDLRIQEEEKVHVAEDVRSEEHENQ